MKSRLLTAVAAAAALSSGASVALTQAFGASAATGTPQPSATRVQQQTNTILRDIDRRLQDVNANLAAAKSREGTMIAQLTSVQQKQVTANQFAAKTYNNLFFRPTWLNRGVSRYGYLGRIQQMLSAMCGLQAVTAHNFDYCTDNVSGTQPTP